MAGFPTKSRPQIVDELVRSEASYVQNLRCIFDVYVPRIQKYIKSIDGFGELLAQMKTILDLHRRLLDAFKLRTLGGIDDDIALGDIFLRFAPFFRVYGDIISMHESVSVSLRERIDSDSSLDRILKECRHDVKCRKSTLQGLLISPIQRIPRYSLLLGTLLDNTPESNGDREQLIRARDLVVQITSQVNQAAHDEISRQMILHVQRKLTAKMSLIDPGRAFMLKSRLFLVLPNNKRKELKFILFNDLLLIVRTFLGRYVLYKKLDLSRRQAFRVDDVIDANAGNGGGHVGRFRFRVATSDAICTIEAHSQEEKVTWVEALKECVDSSKWRIEHDINDHEDHCVEENESGPAPEFPTIASTLRALAECDIEEDDDEDFDECFFGGDRHRSATTSSTDLSSSYPLVSTSSSTILSDAPPPPPPLGSAPAISSFTAAPAFPSSSTVTPTAKLRSRGHTFAPAAALDSARRRTIASRAKPGLLQELTLLSSRSRH